MASDFSTQKFTVGFPAPSGFVPLVKKGDLLVEGDKIGKYTSDCGTVVIDAAKLLKVKRSQTLSLLKVDIGKKVARGQLLAEKKQFLKKPLQLDSPVDGQIDKLIESTGELYLRKEPEEVEITALLKATVGKIGSDSYQLSFEGSTVSAIGGFGQTVAGQAVVLTKKDNLSFQDLSSECASKVVFFAGELDKAVVFKASALAIAGLVFWPKDKTQMINFISEFEKLNDLKGFRPSLLFLETKLARFGDKLSNKTVVLEPEEKRLIIPK